MNIDFKIKNGCRSAEDFKERVKIKLPCNAFCKIQLKNGFYLKLADLSALYPGPVTFTVNLCHNEYMENAEAFTAQVTGFLPSMSHEIEMSATIDFLMYYQWMMDEYARQFFNIRESLKGIQK